MQALLLVLVLATPTKEKRTIDAVKESAARFQVPEAMIWAVIKVESNGDYGAVSEKACVGLMQVNPKTAPSLAKEIGMGWYHLGRIEHNITLGTYYLKSLRDRYGTWMAALTAYNKGPGNFTRDGFKTSGYARKVMARYRLLSRSSATHIEAAPK
jgi:soluble lytic murein transglycosylase-like protein